MNKKTFLAKDPTAIQNFTKQILLLQDFDIDLAKNGKRALEKLSKHA
jgi:DNA-binding NtrC family response regulator